MGCLICYDSFTFHSRVHWYVDERALSLEDPFRLACCCKDRSLSWFNQWLIWCTQKKSITLCFSLRTFGYVYNTCEEGKTKVHNSQAIVPTPHLIHASLKGRKATHCKHNLVYHNLKNKTHQANLEHICYKNSLIGILGACLGEILSLGSMYLRWKNYQLTFRILFNSF